MGYELELPVLRDTDLYSALNTFLPDEEIWAEEDAFERKSRPNRRLPDDEDIYH